MKHQIVTNTAVDLGSDSPFGVGFTVACMNLTAGVLVLEGSDDGTTYSTLCTCSASTGATAIQPATLKRYVRVSTAGTLYLLGG